ncbi:DHA2 family efflux MFS transporter permease subunit [Occultella glacieicola]|uniref:DHA2 family efflux MFS transporter permease subunit n=1 Tax=Occultella glacieicola TaxID=2518684 RepID=A0ABY2E8Z9_9MICO|nr:MDR family MFS transporter [Occultella glacieicola]TDE97467.1 DHA2 family efflux MFS transporter permease subunit [Occultella glacieicola]
MTTAPTTPGGSSGTLLDRRALALLFAGLILSMLLASLNQTILATALPTLVGELQGAHLMVWVITVYILASTVMMPVYGKLGDLIGRKPLLVGAIVLFMIGSVVSALTIDMTGLIVGRTIQGLGGGGLIILSQAIIADVVPPRERGKYMGIMGGVFAFSSVAGPLLGGWLTEGPGWRWAFWMNIPLGLAALAAALFLMPLPQRRRGRPHLDFGGMALIAVGTTCLVLLGTWGGSHYAWNSPLILGLIAGTLVSAALFVFVEGRTREPIIPLRLFADRNFNLTTVAGLFIGIGMFGVLGYMPTYLQMVAGQDATASGLLMVPMMGSMLLVSTASGWYVSRTGRYKWLPIAGAVLLAAALVGLSTLTAQTAIWVACAYLAVLGVGLGASMQILVLVVQNSFPVTQVGTATASNNFFRQIGGTLGSAVVGSVFSARLLGLLTERLPGADAAVDGGVNALTPDVVKHLDDGLRIPIVEAYNDALTPIYLVIAPLAVLAAILLCFIEEKPLATRIEREVQVESTVPAEAPVPAELAEGTQTSAPGPHRSASARPVAGGAAVSAPDPSAVDGTSLASRR